MTAAAGQALRALDNASYGDAAAAATRLPACAHLLRLLVADATALPLREAAGADAARLRHALLIAEHASSLAVALARALLQRGCVTLPLSVGRALLHDALLREGEALAILRTTASVAAVYRCAREQAADALPQPASARLPALPLLEAAQLAALDSASTDGDAMAEAIRLLLAGDHEAAAAVLGGEGGLAEAVAEARAALDSLDAEPPLPGQRLMPILALHRVVEPQ